MSSSETEAPSFYTFILARGEVDSVERVKALKHLANLGLEAISIPAENFRDLAV